MRPIAPVAIAAEAGLFALALGLGWWTGVPPLARLRWNWTALALAGIATLPLLLALRWSLATSLAPMRQLVRLAEERLTPLFSTCSAAELGVIALAAGMGEETLFRGWLQPWLGQWLPPWAAVAGGAVVFGTAHPLTPAYVVAATVVGGYLGALTLLSGNLLLPIATHALYDFVALSLLVRLKPASPSDVL